jgi:outer membrane protein TolC
MNLEQTRKSYEVGLLEENDVDQLNLTVKRTENDLTTLDNQIKTMSRLLKYQLGVSSDVNLELTSTLDNLITENIISDSAYTFILEDHIDYKLLDTQEELQRLLLNREKTMYLPTVSGFYTYSDKTNKTAFDFTINHMIGIGVSLPILTSGSRAAKVSQARIEKEQAQNMKEQESERLILTAQQARYDYQTALRKYYNEKENFELSEKVFNKATERYRLGMMSSLELSIFNNQYLTAQLTYATAIQELLTSKVSLDKAYSQL